MKTLKHYKDAFFWKSTSFFMENRSAKLKNRHIVVFESDDWGSIRMPSLEVLRLLLDKKVAVNSPDTYDRIDTLASNEDLTRLIEVLSSVKDANGNPTILTMNCVTANPDFERIKKSGFQTYYYEKFTDTLKRYPRHDRSFELWKEGINEKVFMPQFHGREHLNFQRWMKCLREGHHDSIEAFNQNMFAIKVEGKRLLPAYEIDTEEEKVDVIKAIHEGLKMFEELFGFRSLSMIAPCYTWDDYVEDAAFAEGVKIIQGNYQQKHATYTGKKNTGRYLGEKNKNGQIYLTRNCSFEPSNEKECDRLYCLKQISKQLKSERPAIVSCHRLNFIGDLDKKNREVNLKEFGLMLKQIVSLWPDVEFMSSDQLGLLLLSEEE